MKKVKVLIILLIAIFLISGCQTEIISEADYAVYSTLDELLLTNSLDIIAIVTVINEPVAKAFPLKMTNTNEFTEENRINGLSVNAEDVNLGKVAITTEYNLILDEVIFGELQDGQEIILYRQVGAYHLFH